MSATTTDLESRVRAAQAAVGDGNDWEYDQPAVMQRLIDTGQAWLMEGSCGRAAMDSLESGACFLPDTDHRDFYGNRLPARSKLKAGTKGTLENSARFYELT